MFHFAADRNTETHLNRPKYATLLMEIFPLLSLVVLYGCETWSLTLREEMKLRVIENMVLREYLDLGGTR